MHIDCVHTALCGTNSCVHIDFKWSHLHRATITPSSDLWNSVYPREGCSLLIVDVRVHGMPFLVLTHNAQLCDPDQSGSKPPPGSGLVSRLQDAGRMNTRRCAHKWLKMYCEQLAKNCSTVYHFSRTI